VKELQKLLKVSRSRAYGIVEAGHVQSLRIGRIVLVDADSIKAYMEKWSR
jgi:excisionase family DNA binding protein